MGTDLLSQLSSEDQLEVDRLNDEIKQVFIQLFVYLFILVTALFQYKTDICD